MCYTPFIRDLPDDASGWRQLIKAIQRLVMHPNGKARGRLLKSREDPHDPASVWVETNNQNAPVLRLVTEHTDGSEVETGFTSLAFPTRNTLTIYSESPAMETARRALETL